MAHTQEKKVRLRSAYISGLPIEVAAEKTGVPLPTARRWYRDARQAGDDWDKFQAASLIVSGGGIEQAMGRIIAAALLRCEALLDTPPPDIEGSIKAMSTLGDTIAKLNAAGRAWMPEADRLAIETAAVKRFAEMILTRIPGCGEALVGALEQFARGGQ
jgi:hypothetical protein